MHTTKLLASGVASRWARGSLEVPTSGQACHDVTAAVNEWLTDIAAGDGVIVAASAHTTASLTVQENADPNVQHDLVTALGRIAPADAPYRHGEEGPDDMPGHIKAVVTGHAVDCLVAHGQLLLGQWQAIYLVEHRIAPHARTVWLHYTGS